MPQNNLKWDFSTLILSGCLIYIMLRPVGSGNVLYPVFGLMGVIGALRVMQRRLTFDSRLKTASILGFAVAALGIVVGLYNPGILNGLLTWVIAPAVFWVWAASLQRGTLAIVVRASAIGTILLSGLIILYVGGQIGAVPSILPAWLLEETGAGFDGTGEATAIRLYGLSTLAAAAPMWTASLLVRRSPLLPGYLMRWAAAIMSTSAALMGGRRAIVVVVILTPLLVWLLQLLMRSNQKIQVTPVAAVAWAFSLPLFALLAPSFWKQPAVRDAWLAVRDLVSPSVKSEDGVVRQEQIVELMSALGQSPVWGHGFGAVLNSGYSRSIERPWNFEMQYHLVAFQVGVLGTMLLAVAAVCVLSAARIAALSHPDMRPVLISTGTAALAMVIANATNPYLQAPGHMWPLFIFIGAINAALRLDSDNPGRFQVAHRKASIT